MDLKTTKVNLQYLSFQWDPSTSYGRYESVVTVEQTGDVICAQSSTRSLSLSLSQSTMNILEKGQIL